MNDTRQKIRKSLGLSKLRWEEFFEIVNEDYSKSTTLKVDEVVSLERIIKNEKVLTFINLIGKLEGSIPELRSNSSYQETKKHAKDAIEKSFSFGKSTISVNSLIDFLKKRHSSFNL